MSLNCGENPLLKKVQESKDALKAKMAALKGAATGAVAGALADIKAAKAQLKKDLLAAVPEIPKLPDFQKELDELKAAVAAKTEGWSDKLREFENSWGGAIEDIQETITALSDIANAPLSALADKLGKLDICKQEDVEGEPDPDNPGKLKKKEKPIKVQDSTEPPKEDPKTPPPVDTAETVITTPKVSSSEIDAFVSHDLRHELDDVVYEAAESLCKEIKKSSKAFAKLKKKAEKDYKKIPKSFKQKYPSALFSEYYLVEGITIPDSVSETAYEWNRKTALGQMKKNALTTLSLVRAVFGKKALEQLSFYNGTTWKDNVEFQIAASAYTHHGFGINETAPEYIRPFEAYYGTPEAKQYIKPTFDLKPYDYTSSKIPTIYSLLDFQNSGSGTVIKDHATILEDILEAAFSATLRKGKFKGEKVLPLLASSFADVPVNDILSFSLPTSPKAFLPKALGGDVRNFEDEYISMFGYGWDTQREVDKYQDLINFVDHWMYKGSGSVFVTSYEEHVQMAKLGYTHSQS